MSYLLELLGRGLIAHLSGAFASALGGDSDESLEDLQAAVDAQPEDASLAVKLGTRRLRSDNAAAARDIFVRILAREPAHFVARLGLACAFDELGKLDDCLNHLRIAQKIEPASPAILFCLGYCHERAGRLEEAVAYYHDSVTICPTLRNAYERMAAIDLKQGQTDLAIDRYEKLCKLDSHRTDLQLTLANLLLKAGDRTAAIERYQHALTLEPDNWTAHNDLVSAYEEAGLIREAIEQLHTIVQAQPECADSRLRLGDLYARIGNDAAAIAQYDHAARINPEYLEANVKLGTQHLRAGRFTDAAKWFSQALEINDRLLSAYIGIGVAQHADGRTADALASIEMARNIEPNSTLLFSEVARMQLKAAAAQESQRHLALPPAAPADASHEPSAEGVTDLISQQIERLREALHSRPNHADLHYRLGLLLRNRGEIDDAIAAFRRAVEVNPSYMKALIKLGLALSEVGKNDEAIEVLTQAVDLRPEYVDLHYQLGILFAQRHQFEIAVEHLELAAAGNPKNVDFQSNLALALQNMGLVDRAQATWQIVTDLTPASPQATQARAAMAKPRSHP